MLGSTYTVGKPGSLRVRKQYYDEYSYLSLGVLQAQTWLSTRVLYNFDKNNDVDGRRQDQRNSARTLSARANVQKFPSYQSCTWGIYLCCYQHEQCLPSTILCYYNDCTKQNSRAHVCHAHYQASRCRDL